MAKLSNRIAAAWQALVSESPGLAEYAASTVRPHEVGNQLSRYRQTHARDLVARFYKWVAVAASRQATGVASTPLRVYRTGRTGRKSAWDGLPVSRKEKLRQKSRAGLYVRKSVDLYDDIEEIDDPLHPLVKLLNTANPLMNGYVLKERCQFDISLTGNAYWHIVAGGDGVPQEAWPLPPQFTRPVPSQDVVVSEYVYGRGNEVERIIPAAQIIPFIQTNPLGDPYMGFGDLAKCVDDQDLSVAFSQFRLAMLDNGAQPGMVLVGKTMGNEQRQQLEDQLNRKYAGVRNANRTIVISGDIEVNPNGMTEKEVSFLNSEESVLQAIANCFDVPVSLLKLDSAALATAKAATPQFQEFCLLPRCRRIEDVLNQRLVPMFKGDPRLDADSLYLCFDDVVTKDYEAAATRVSVLFGGDVITKNEARQEIDYDPVPDGDKFKSDYAAAQAEALVALTPRPDPGDEGSGEPLDERGGDPDDAKDAPPRDDAKALRAYSHRDWIMGGACPCGCASHPRSVRKALPSEFLTFTEQQLQALVRSWFNSSAMSIVTQAVTTAGLADVSDALAVSFEAAVKQPIEAVFSRGWNFGSAELATRGGKAELLMPFSEKPARYLREYEGKLSKSVSDTVNERLKNELADGVAAGETIPQLTDRARVTMSETSGIAAERIARTETARAFETAREATWKESGFVWGKKWLLAPDACSFCTAVASKKPVPLGQSFASKGSTLTDSFGNTMLVDYSDVDTPPLHPSCRCSTVMVMDKP